VILTLPWKELREHRSMWLTMVITTCVLSFGISRLASGVDGAVATTTLTVLVMAVTYGVVCGSMMFAGEHEGGTLVFLDVFLGRRGVLWMGKFLVGAVLAVCEALAVALVLYMLGQAPTSFVPALVGVGQGQAFALHGDVGPGLREQHFIWFLVLPVVTLEAYAWGLLGSVMTRRALTAAAVAALLAMPFWTFTVPAPPPVFFGLRMVAALAVLFISFFTFVNQAREVAVRPPPPSEALPDRRRRFIELWEEFEQEDWYPDPAREEYPRPAPVPVFIESATIDLEAVHGPSPSTLAGEGAAAEIDLRDDWVSRPSRPAGFEDSPRGGAGKSAQDASPGEALLWLTRRQAVGVLSIIAAASLLTGCLLVMSPAQVVWPIATLLLGVACGTAAFAPEQRDLSYQFLAAQRLPLGVIWRFKIVFWFGAATLATIIMALPGSVLVVGRMLGRPPHAALPPVLDFGTLPQLIGPLLFMSVSLVYGFCIGQVFVWLCRKTIMALVLSALVSAAALGLWLPSLLCQGMSGWQLWLPPLIMLAATQSLVRAWAGGRIKERRPMAALVGFALAALTWVGVNWTYRAWEVPDVGQPLDAVAYRAALPRGDAAAASQKIHEASAQIDQPGDVWLTKMAEAARLPAGVLETPRSDGQSSALTHLPACREMVDRLVNRARARGLDSGVEHLAQILSLSRNLRNKAPIESYVTGVKAEQSALEGLDVLLSQGKPTPDLLRRVLDELNRHAAETPPPLDCLQTECFRAGGLLGNPAGWTFAPGAGGAAGRVPEVWLARGIALSLETPWEAERATRLWQVVWAGLFRSMETPYGQLPAAADEHGRDRETTKRILRDWLPATDGPGASLTPAQLARLLDASWLADERLFCSVTRLRAAATRSEWRVDAARLVVALELYNIQQGKPAENLEHLVPNYLPELPTDPYSGKAFRYRISTGEQIDSLGNIRAGQGIVWSTGPDRVDDGGRLHGGGLADDDPQWSGGGFDLISIARHRK
jgi:hypothetical protein